MEVAISGGTSNRKDLYYYAICINSGHGEFGQGRNLLKKLFQIQILSWSHWKGPRGWIKHIDQHGLMYTTIYYIPM